VPDAVVPVVVDVVPPPPAEPPPPPLLLVVPPLEPPLANFPVSLIIFPVSSLVVIEPEGVVIVVVPPGNIFVVFGFVNPTVFVTERTMLFIDILFYFTAKF